MNDATITIPRLRRPHTSRRGVNLTANDLENARVIAEVLNLDGLTGAIRWALQEAALMVREHEQDKRVRLAE